MGFSPKYHFLTNQSRRKPHWSVSSNNKAMVTLPEVTLYKSHKKKSPLAIEITEIRKEPGFTNSVHPQLPGAQSVQQQSIRRTQLWLSQSFSISRADTAPVSTAVLWEVQSAFAGLSQRARQEICHQDFGSSHRSSSVCFLHQKLGWEG